MTDEMVFYGGIIAVVLSLLIVLIAVPCLAFLRKKVDMELLRDYGLNRKREHKGRRTHGKDNSVNL